MLYAVEALAQRGDHADEKVQLLVVVSWSGRDNGSGRGGGRDGGRGCVGDVDDGRGGGDGDRRCDDGGGDGPAGCLACEVLEADGVLMAELATVLAFLCSMHLAICVLSGAATFAVPFEGLVPNGLTCLVVGDIDEVLVHPGSVDFHCIGVDEAGGGGRGVRRGPAHRGAFERVVEVHNQQVGVATLRDQLVVRGGTFRVVVQPFDVLGGKSALETVEEVLLGPASAGCPGFEVREVV